MNSGLPQSLEVKWFRSGTWSKFKGISSCLVRKCSLEMMSGPLSAQQLAVGQDKACSSKLLTHAGVAGPTNQGPS